MKKLIRNNHGVALITVVIGVMFCLLLTSTMLRVSLLGLQSRSINNQVSDNYYDAECVIDTIRLNLQNLSAKAWKESSNDVGNSTNYIKRAYVILTADTESNCTVGNHTFTGTAYTNIKSLLQDNAKNGGTVESFSSIEVLGTGTQLKGIVIHDVEVKYENPTTKLVSYIKMDVTISAPLYASADKPPLASYSMFVGTGAAIGGSDYNPSAGTNKIGYLEQQGNVYIGYRQYTARQYNAGGWDNTLGRNLDSFTWIGTDKGWNGGHPTALEVNCRNTCIFSGENVLINGDVKITQEGTLQLTGQKADVRGKIYIGENCHLVVGDNTILNCQDILIYVNGSYKSVSELSSSQMPGTAVYPKGEPKNYYGTSGGWSNYPYHSNSASIVYLEATVTETADGKKFTYTGQGYDAKISMGSITKQGANGASLTGPNHINITPDDPKLQPKKNIPSGHEKVPDYDQRFAEIIDIAYFEKYFFCTDDGPNNNKIRSEVKSTDLLNASSKKYTPSSTDMQASSLSGSDTQKKITLESTVTGKPDYTCQIIVGFNQGDAQNVNPGGTSSGNFIVSNLDLQVRMNAVGDKYSGVYITSGNLWIEKNDGLTVGESVLSYSKEIGGDLKKFIDTIGRQGFYDTTQTDTEKLKNSIINNLFKGGIQCFYKVEAQAGESGKKADPKNAKMDLIDFSDYEKH